MTNIEPRYVTFEQAKLLKEKGFNLVVDSCYRSDGLFYKPTISGSELKHSNILNNESCSAPEQWQVVEWLRVEKGIWIEVCKPVRQKLFRFNIDSLNTNENLFTSVVSFSSPQEAYSAAFDYVLNKLI